MGLKLPICLYLCRMKSYFLISVVSIQYVRLNICMKYVPVFSVTLKEPLRIWCCHELKLPTKPSNSAAVLSQSLL